MSWHGAALYAVGRKYKIRAKTTNGTGKNKTKQKNKGAFMVHLVFVFGVRVGVDPHSMLRSPGMFSCGHETAPGVQNKGMLPV